MYLIPSVSCTKCIMQIYNSSTFFTYVYAIITLGLFNHSYDQNSSKELTNITYDSFTQKQFCQNLKGIRIKLALYEYILGVVYTVYTHFPTLGTVQCASGKCACHRAQPRSTPSGVYRRQHQGEGIHPRSHFRQENVLLIRQQLIPIL